MDILYQITSRFLQQESFRNHKHLGVDFAIPNGTELRSIQDGIVEKVLNHNSLGKAVLVKWEDGKTAIYGHMSNIKVQIGEKVQTGDLLGYSGNTGNVYGVNGGYHLHFGLKEGNEYIDPSPYIDHIQNMNNPQFLAKLQTPDIVQQSYSWGDLLKDYSSVYSDFFSTIKINLIHLIQSIDYSVFVQYIQYLFQFFS